MTMPTGRRALPLSDDMTLNSEEADNPEERGSPRAGSRPRLTDDPLGKTTRMWYQIGDEYLLGKARPLTSTSPWIPSLASPPPRKD